MQYEPPPERPLPGPAEIHVWRVDYRRVEPLDRAARALSQSERDRAARFHREADRRRYVAAHAALRDVLGRCLALAPERLVFELGEHGKPFLRDAPSLQFNLSDTDGLALIAVAGDRPLGVDVERHRDDPTLLDVADKFFSPGEVHALRGVDPEGRLGAFFRIWTRKEAFIKAIGEGLARDLDSFDVSLDPGGGACLLATRPDPEEARLWALFDLDAGPGLSAALVARVSAGAPAGAPAGVPAAALRAFEWSPSDALAHGGPP
jgi:4'-phosphopantetheinyl transferase